MRLLFSLSLILLLTGCLETYNPLVYKDGVINNAELSTIAKSNDNIINYAENLYVVKPDYKDDKMITPDHELINKKYDKYDLNKLDYVDTQFFKTFCEEKEGNVYVWSFAKYFEYNRGRGIGNKFYTCEKGNKVNSALLYAVGSEDQFYRVYKKYLTENSFDNSNQFYSVFSSDDGTITITKDEVYNPEAKYQFVSPYHTVVFKYKNDANDPVDIDLNELVLLIGQKKYKVEKVEWKRYTNDGKSYGVIQGGNKLKFNPGQEIVAELNLTIPGVTEYTKEDILASTFVAGAHKFGKFKEISLYDKDKVAVK